LTRHSVRCTHVNNTEEFGDIVGQKGSLHLHKTKRGPGVNYFSSATTLVGLSRKRVTTKDDTIKVFTTLGNVFTFQKITPAKETTK